MCMFMCPSQVANILLVTCLSYKVEYVRHYGLMSFYFEEYFLVLRPFLVRS